MNLKKTLFSVLGAAALTVSLMAPAALAEDVVQTDNTSKSTIVEEGELRFALSNDVSFPVAAVSSNDSDTVSTASNRVLRLNDYRSSSDGYQLVMEASNLETTDGTTEYFIDSENLSVARVTTVAHSSCLGNAAPPVEGNNAYQDVTFDLTSTHQSLADPVTMVTGGEGRGCRHFETSYTWQLFVPAGTYTGGDEAVYEGDITITNTMAPGEEEPGE